MAYVLIQTLLVLMFYDRAAEGERFYQYRDHRDQNKYLTKKTDVNVVRNEFQAEIQLEKYGYLKCKVRRKRRSIFPGMASLSEGIDPLFVENDIDACSQEQVREAITEYQKTYKLPTTGKLDEQTKRLMSESRCGNRDSSKKDKTETSNSDDSVTSSSIISNLDQNFKHEASSTNAFSKFSNKFKSGHRPWKRSASRTTIMKTLLEKSDKNRLKHYREKYLHNYIKYLKQEDPLMLKPLSEQERHKRSVIAHVVHDNSDGGLNIWDGQRFTKQTIRWRLLRTGFSTRIPVEEQRATLNLAFRMWSEVIPVRFEEDNSGDINNVDIEIAFGRGNHQNCDRKFDGHGGEIAHSWSGRNVHFDDEEDYKSIESISKEKEGIYLLRVAVHEIGHVLGLSHTTKTYSIMYAIYNENVAPEKEFELGWEDRKDVQQLYGVCKGRFSTVFDWVRKRPDNRFIYNTYFFRENHYWMYENHANRTRYGDPLYIAREWDGVPDNVDGYLHIWYFSGKDIVDSSYFFKGENYYLYNSSEDKVVDGWPRLIQEDFGPKPGDTVSIPDNLDTVFFDMRDKNIYFFKDDTVYVYDPELKGDEKGCCVRVRSMAEEFPPLDGEEPLPPNLDSVYYSYKDQAMYFFKDEEVWKNELFHPKQKQIRNGIKKIGNWYDKWFDICDVRNMAEGHIAMEQTVATSSDAR